MKTHFSSARARISFALRFLLALTFVFGFSTFGSTARADGTFIAAANRYDFLHDSSRGFIYISDGAFLRRYNVSTGLYSPPLDLGAQGGQIDISPDGNTLAVALTPTPGTAPVASPPFALIDLNSFTRGALPSTINTLYGSVSLAFDNAGTLLVVPGANTETQATPIASIWRRARSSLCPTRLYTIRCCSPALTEKSSVTPSVA